MIGYCLTCIHSFENYLSNRKCVNSVLYDVLYFLLELSKGTTTQLTEHNTIHITAVVLVSIFKSVFYHLLI